MTESLSPQPETEPNNEVLGASAQLGEVCRQIIAAADTLTLMDVQHQHIKTQAEKRSPSRFVDTKGSTTLVITNIFLDDGSDYSLEIQHTDDAGEGEQIGKYDPEDPHANFLMTFVRNEVTANGHTRRESFSTSMAKQVKDRQLSPTGNPHVIDVWDSDNPGYTQQTLRGSEIVPSRQFQIMQEVAQRLTTEVDIAYNRILLNS